MGFCEVIFGDLGRYVKPQWQTTPFGFFRSLFLSASVSSRSRFFFLGFSIDEYRSSVFILCAGGVVCSYYALRSCEFFSYKSNDPTILPGPFYNVPEGYVGLFYHYDYEGGDGADLTTCDQFYDNFFVLQSDEWNLLFKIGQIAAVVGPAGAATAFLLNIMEWCCWQLTWTFFITFFMLFCGFVGQGLTFMIYGQTEFWYEFVYFFCIHLSPSFPTTVHLMLLVSPSPNIALTMKRPKSVV